MQEQESQLPRVPDVQGAQWVTVEHCLEVRVRGCTNVIVEDCTNIDVVGTTRWTDAVITQGSVAGLLAARGISDMSQPRRMTIRPDGTGYFDVDGWPGENTRDGYRMEPLEVVPLVELEAARKSTISEIVHALRNHADADHEVGGFNEEAASFIEQLVRP